MIAFLAALLAAVTFLHAFDRIPAIKINETVAFVLIMCGALVFGMAAPVLWWA